MQIQTEVTIYINISKSNWFLTVIHIIYTCEADAVVCWALLGTGVVLVEAVEVGVAPLAESGFEVLGFALSGAATEPKRMPKWK